jgi:hypothetical protein
MGIVSKDSNAGRDEDASRRCDVPCLIGHRRPRIDRRRSGLVAGSRRWDLPASTWAFGDPRRPLSTCAATSSCQRLASRLAPPIADLLRQSTEGDPDRRTDGLPGRLPTSRERRPRSRRRRQPNRSRSQQRCADPCGLTDPDVAAVGSNVAAAVGSRRRRPLQADARVVEFLDKRPARVLSSSSTCLRNSGRLKAEVAE